MKKGLKILLIVICVVVLAVLSYLAYVFIDYHRIGDGPVAISGEADDDRIPVDEKLKIVSYNIGFGAYESDYGFFMDGGTESWAWSEERLEKNIGNIADFLEDQDADLYILQEVDRDSTRSYHMDELVPIVKEADDMVYTWAQNYDSPFLFYPFTQPHGKSVSGLLTLSPYAITRSDRMELPIENTLMKLLDLDRCYCKNRIPAENGKELVLYDFHLSAYTSDGTIATEQLKLILEDMQAEYDKGNYCIAGGDFNKDLLNDSEAIFGKADKEYSWAQPIPAGTFDDYDVTLVAPFDEKDPVPSCRNADGPYHAGQYVLTVDGFMVSANVTVKSAKVLDTGFAYSDHNPVEMRFVLEK